MCGVLGANLEAAELSFSNSDYRYAGYYGAYWVYVLGFGLALVAYPIRIAAIGMLHDGGSGELFGCISTSERGIGVSAPEKWTHSRFLVGFLILCYLFTRAWSLCLPHSTISCITSSCRVEKTAEICIYVWKNPTPGPTVGP